MFVLSIIKDTVPVHPQHFDLPPEQAIINELNKKYANRVLHEVGLCVCVFDLSEAGEGRVRFGDGFYWYKVSVGFFDDIYVPLIYLPEPSAFDPNERAHFWLPGSETTNKHEMLDSAVADRMYIDAGEVVRVRVEADEFYDDEPGPPKATEGVHQAPSTEGRRAPYTITCSMSEQGLGPVAWWKDAGVEAMDEE
ncbi:hypothetical protein EUX98_g1498 [Antrodiella citrinella]|uniref:Ig-like domain-containing protein n=1 Tax=Antrodiella citrinella TaxID=2447956 RepID=A0A4S4N2W1_9APHY|nr:hypothetical protein EUX98_g1498 [Antrodiella citrinella]